MLRTLVGAAALAAMCGGAQAAVVGSSAAGVIEGTGTADLTGNVATFSWDTTFFADAFDNVFAGFVAFEINTRSDIVLTGYTDGGGGFEVRVSGAIVEKTDGLDGDRVPGGLLTTEVVGCGDRFFIIEFASCNYVTASDYTGDGADISSKPGDVVLSGLEPGFYRLIQGESGSPAIGSSSYEIRESAIVVPLPASFPLILVGLGGLALFRRKQT